MGEESKNENSTAPASQVGRLVMWALNLNGGNNEC